MKFKDWINREIAEMTSTGDVAGFSRICIPMVSRSWMPQIAFDMEPTVNYPKKKKKIYRLKLKSNLDEISWVGLGDINRITTNFDPLTNQSTIANCIIRK
jgi:hypothetical protein